MITPITISVGIPGIDKLEANIHAGAKYLRFLYDRYFAEEPMDQNQKLLFLCASYNAGPARIRRIRKKAEEQERDPNRWFGQVEVTTSEVVGRETVQYVSNITKYYIAYRLVAQKEQARAAGAPDSHNKQE